MQIATLLLPVLAFQSGGKLDIKDLKVGTGAAVKAGDYVTVDYTGTLLNGKQFDSSIGRKPFKFVVGAGQVIKGWDQGLVGMKVGGSRQLTIPSSLGYGARGAGADIPPNATLKFKISLKGVERVKIQTLRKGSGPAAGAGSTIQVFYKGSLTDGKMFDSNVGRSPFEVVLGQSPVVPGFTMGLLGIKQGEKRKVTIPSALGYGERGAGGVIPPNATLIFEIEAAEVRK